MAPGQVPPAHSRRATLLAAFFLAIHAALFLLAAVPAFRDSLWGFHAWTFLPASTVGLIVVLALAVTALLRFGRPRGFSGLLVGAGIAALILVTFRDTTHLLGDGQLWLAAVRERPAHHPHEPLAFGLATLVTRGDPSETRLVWLSHLEGLATLGLLWLLAGRLVSPSGPAVDRRWIFALTATAGATLFGFGYIEAYPTLGLVVAALLLALINFVQGRIGFPVVGFLFGMSVATHALALALTPAILVALTRRRPAWSALGTAIGLGLIPMALAWIVLPIRLPAGGAEAGRHWVQLMEGLSFYPWGVPAWLLEQTNRWGMAAGAAPALLVAGLLARATFRKLGSGLRDDESLVLGAAALGLMAPALLLDMEGSRGAAADWDAFAIAGWPLAALAGRIVVRRELSVTGETHHARPGGPSLVLWLAPVLSLIGLCCTALVAHRSDTASARFEALLTGSFRTPRARSWGWETMAAWKRGHGDMTGAAAAYDAALAEQPRNVRLLRNAAGAHGRIGQPRRAADALVRLTEEVPEDAGAWLHLGMELEQVGSIDSSRVALRRALTLEPGSIEARNELARSLLRSKESRREARELLAESLELSPGQGHAAELRRMLERLDRDGYGPGEVPSPP